MDHYRGSALSSVIMFTDGVTTRDETIAQTADYAAQKGISLFFVGVGDENDMRKLELHDLQVEDQIYIGDTAVFEARLTGKGYKDLTVPVILKTRGKDGKEHEEDRMMVKVDPAGKSVKIRLKHQPKEVGSKLYIIEVEPTKLDANEKPLPSANLRLERTIEVIDTKLIKVLMVEGQPRYEFRYIKYLMERESPDKKKKKSIELKVLLLDADDDFAATDKTALQGFPGDAGGVEPLRCVDHRGLRSESQEAADPAEGYRQRSCAARTARGRRGRSRGAGCCSLRGRRTIRIPTRGRRWRT